MGKALPPNPEDVQGEAAALGQPDPGHASQKHIATKRVDQRKSDNKRGGGWEKTSPPISSLMINNTRTPKQGQHKTMTNYTMNTPRGAAQEYLIFDIRKIRTKPATQ